MSSKDINWEEGYREFVLSTNCTLKDKPVDLVHHVLSLTAEAGEVSGMITSFIRSISDDATLPDLSELANITFQNKLKSELSDVLYHLTCLAALINLSLEDLAHYNQEKLTNRLNNGSLFDKSKRDAEDTI